MNNNFFRSIPVYCSTAGNERVIQRKNAREIGERDKEWEGRRERACKGWQLDSRLYIYEGIQETLGVCVNTLVQMFTYKILSFTETLQPLIYM